MKLTIIQVKKDLNINLGNMDKKEEAFINMKMRKDLRLQEIRHINCKG